MQNCLNNPKLKNCIEFAQISLAGKKRKSGEDVIDHCLRVADKLVEYSVNDVITLEAAILHHSLSDGAATIDDIKKEFGDEIASMVESLEKLRVIRLQPNMQDEFIENLRKMFLALARDLRIVIIKLMDIDDNLTTLKYLDPLKQTEVAEETLEIFAPLSERLGIGEMKGEMQDLAFECLYPKEAEMVKKLRKKSIEQLNKMLLKIKRELAIVFHKEKINFEIQCRTKHLYSLYTKLKRPEINFNISHIYDLIAFRVIVNTTEDCYKALGIIHKLWKPLPNYVRDYIVNPKPNGYQSIHTTVFGPGDYPFEIQIRTQQMHEEAEYGVAAHWHYSENKSKGATDTDLSQGFATSVNKLEWVKNLSQWQKEIINNQEFLKTIRTDFFGERIFCFTPKGDVKDLPKGATPIDFAYSIHTGLGNLVVGANVNGKIVSLDTKLQNSDVVEVILAKDTHKKPNRDWLNFVATNLAKKKIKKSLNLKNKVKSHLNL